MSRQPGRVAGPGSLPGRLDDDASFQERSSARLGPGQELLWYLARCRYDAIIEKLVSLVGCERLEFFSGPRLLGQYVSPGEFARGSLAGSARHDLGHRCAELRPARSFDPAGPTQQQIDRHQLDVVEVGDTALCDSFGFAKGDFGGQIAHRRRDGSDQDSLKSLGNAAAGEDDDGTDLVEIGPPDLTMRQPSQERARCRLRSAARRCTAGGISPS